MEAEPGRIPCIVPFCGRTAPRQTGEGADTVIICGKHWRLGDKRLRAVYTRHTRRGNFTARARVFWRLAEQIIVRASMEVDRGAFRRAPG